MSLFNQNCREYFAVLFVVHCIHLIEYQQDTIVKLGPEVWLLYVGGGLELTTEQKTTTTPTWMIREICLISFSVTTPLASQS